MSKQVSNLYKHEHNLLLNSLQSNWTANSQETKQKLQYTNNLYHNKSFIPAKRKQGKHCDTQL